MRYLFIFAVLCLSLNATAEHHKKAASAELEPEKVVYKKAEARPVPKRWPPKLQKMYRHPHPHPAVVGVMRPHEPVVRGKQVWVNSPGITIHKEKGRLVHSHAVPISEKEAKEAGYIEAGKPIPRQQPSSDKSSEAAACCTDHTNGECDCCESCDAAAVEDKE